MHHPANAELFVANQERAAWHDRALWFVRAKRDRSAARIPEWESLRDAAAKIKQRTLERLDDHLVEFATNAERLGAVVHWASTAEEHNQIVHSILEQRNVRRVVKSKSMLTEECHLNPYLIERGIEVVDSDLGEWIVQLRDEPPSHIVLPAIHIKKAEVGELFHRHLQTQKGATDPTYLTQAARHRLREDFLAAQAGITGVNFALADTGGFVVCTNEGNADLGVSLPPLHIACMGIEKLIPSAGDLAIFLRLLARSATGQPITTYSSHFHGPLEGGELHIVLVDNGRSRLLGSDDFRNSLRCIRCGACLNTCPVYRRSGGHSYETAVPGPIGSILAPASNPAVYKSLPSACSLCGSCSDVCPVRIDIHNQLLTWRRELVAERLIPWQKRWGMRIASSILRRPFAFRWLGSLARCLIRWLPRPLVHLAAVGWTRKRDLPHPPRRSFREQYQAGQRDDES